MPEISILAEQLAVVRRDGDVGIPRDYIKQLFDYSVKVLHGVNLALAERTELPVIKHFGVGLAQFSTHNGLVQMFEHSVHAADARPLVRWLIRPGVWSMRFLDLPQVERAQLFS